MGRGTTLACSTTSDPLPLLGQGWQDGLLRTGQGTGDSSDSALLALQVLAQGGAWHTGDWAISRPTGRQDRANGHQRPHLINDGVSLKTGSEREEHMQEATLTSSAPWNVPLSDQGAELWETPEAVACPGTCPTGDRSPRSRSLSTLYTPGDRKPHPSPRPSRALGRARPTLLRGRWWMLALCAEAQGGRDLARPFLGKQEGGSLGPGRGPTCPHRAGNRKRLRRGEHQHTPDFWALLPSIPLPGGPRQRPP